MFPMGPPLANEPPTHAPTAFAESARRAVGVDGAEAAAVLVSEVARVEAAPFSAD